MAETRLPRVLYVDESPDARSAFSEALAHAFAIRGMAPGELSADLSCDVVVGGGRALGSGGLPDLLPHAPRILLVDEEDRGLLALWMERLTPYLVVRAPWGFEEIRLAVERAVEWALSHPAPISEPEEEAPSSLSPPQHRILTTSPSMVRVLQQISAVADADVSVLVTGETGVGKELVARTIHDESPRAERRFVAQNLAALPAELMTSELFGHVKGAFTGAQKERRGLFELADGGTLFLDEIGELPLGLQSKLLRALQERMVRPLGSRREVAFDARIVAATNVDLERAVRERRFREDLYFRINVVEIALPPLRARGNDILVLASHFLAQFSTQMQKGSLGFSPPVVRKLLDYGWPGNVRELHNTIERAVVMAQHEQLKLADLPTRIAHGKTSAEPSRLMTLDEVEKRHVLCVLESSGGSKSAAAKILGLDRSTLWRKLERFRLEDARGHGGADEPTSEPVESSRTEARR